MSQQQEQLQEIVDRYKLEGARIQIGRERIWPPREGLEPSQKAIETLEAAFSQDAKISGSVRISEKGEDLYWISQGKVKQQMAPALQQSVTAYGQQEPTEYIDDQPELRAQLIITELQKSQASIRELAQEALDKYPLLGEEPAPSVEIADDNALPPLPELFVRADEIVNHPIYTEESLFEATLPPPQSFNGTQAQSPRVGLNLENPLKQDSVPQAEYGSRPDGVEIDSPAATAEKTLNASQVLNDGPGTTETTEAVTRSSEMSQGKMPQLIQDHQSDLVPDGREVLKPQPEPLVGRDLYMDVISRSPHVEKQGFDDILETAKDSFSLGEFHDLAFMEQAHKEGITPERITRAIAFGPAVRAMEEKGGTTAETTLYLAEQQTRYRKKNFKADPPFQEPDPHRYPDQSRNVMNPTIQLSKNLDTFTRRVKSPVLQQWGRKLQDLHRQAVPVAIIAAKVLGRTINGLAIVPHHRMDNAARELVGMFGKNGQYSGETFNYDVRGAQAKIALKDGTPVFENGKYNHSVNPGYLLMLKDVPEKVKAAKAELASQIKTFQRPSQSAEVVA